MHVGRYRHIHHLRIGQLQIVHEVDIFGDRFDPEARVELLLLADRRDLATFVVVRRIGKRFVRQCRRSNHIARVHCHSGPWVRPRASHETGSPPWPSRLPGEAWHEKAIRSPRL